MDHVFSAAHASISITASCISPCWNIYTRTTAGDVLNAGTRNMYKLELGSMSRFKS